MDEPITLNVVSVEVIDSADGTSSTTVLASDGNLYPCGVVSIAPGDSGVIMAGHFCMTLPVEGAPQTPAIEGLPPEQAAQQQEQPAALVVIEPVASASIVLTAAAGTATAEQEKPEPDLEVVSAFASQLPNEEQIALRRQRIYQEGHAAQCRLHPLYSLEDAQGLPEVSGDSFLPLTSDDPREIVSFKDEDRRTMRVVLTAEGLGKMASAV